jgi:drug/metabolite transporter (DMT)-like permease
MHQDIWRRAQVVIAAVLFSTGGTAIKGNELTDWQVASFRCAVAAVALLLLVPETRRNWTARLLPAALPYAATLILFALASKRTTAANAIFLQSTAPAYLIVLSPLLLRERLRKADLLLLAGVAAGFLLLVGGPQQQAATAPQPVTGNILAALAGLTWALTVTGLRWAARNGTGITIVVIGNLIACAIALPMALPVERMRWHDAAVVAYLGVFQIGLAYVFLTRGVRRVPAFEAATLLLLEPALNPAWAWLLLGENPGNRAIAGGAIILCSTLANTWWAGRR